MLKWLFAWLAGNSAFLQALDSLMVRSLFAGGFSLLLTFGLGPRVIRALQSAQIGQVIRDDGPQSHLSKKGTPTMGGVLMIIAIAFSTLCWAALDNSHVWLALLALVGFGAVGWVDDYKKLILKTPKGLSAKQKIASQAVIALIIASVLYTMASTPAQTAVHLPLLKDVIIPLGAFYIAFGFFVIVGSSNAVNLTDGLDGLAIVPTMLIAAALGVFAYLSSDATTAGAFTLPFIPHTGELLIVCAAIVGAGLGFLWFNAYPAQLFMGDVGALSLGAVLGTLAMSVRQEILLLVMGGIFVAETVSVILQVGSYRLRKKRIFRMAPLHHHFELAGWPEPRVVIRFWIISVVLVIMGLATLIIG